MKILILLAITVSTLSAQTFDAASVKRSAPETGNMSRSTGGIPRQTDTNRINYPHVSLQSVIAQAYSLAPDQIAGPSWLNDDRFDITATFPAGATRDQLSAMLQHLLAERFHFVAHQETKPRAGYALVIPGKSPPKLKEAKPSDNAGFETSATEVRFHNANMKGVATFLAFSMGRPVADETGLDGHYEITLNASPADLKSGSVFGAIKDLGMKLETRTAPAKFLVIEKVDRIPKEN